VGSSSCRRKITYYSSLTRRRAMPTLLVLRELLKSYFIACQVVPLLDLGQALRAPEPERLAKFRSAKVNWNVIDFHQWKETAMAGKFDCFAIVQVFGG
jgi:hypothetical protein